MATLIKQDGKKISLDEITFDKETSTFIISDGPSGFVLSFQYELEVVEDDDDYLVCLFYKTGIRNNDIFGVLHSDDNRRMGWIFPVSALTTTEHTFSENPHFLRVAFKAYKELLKIVEIQEDPSSLSDDYYNQFSFLKPECVVLCLSRTECGESSEQDFYPALFRYGYSRKFLELNVGDVRTSAANVKLRPISDVLKSESYLYELFEGTVADPHPLARFHLLYQVIEICLDRVLLNELENLTKGVKEKQIFGREIRTRFEDFESEKRRINLLFSKYLSTDASFGHLRGRLLTVCNEFLDLVGRKHKTQEFSEVLYLVRNTIVHDYRNTSRGSEKLFEVNDLLSQLIAEIVTSFSTSVERQESLDGKGE